MLSPSAWEVIQLPTLTLSASNSTQFQPIQTAMPRADSAKMKRLNI